MISSVLVPMDDSEMAESALEYALSAFPEADVTVIHVVGEPSGMMGKAVGLSLSEDFEADAQELAEPVLDRADKIAGEHDREIEKTIKAGDPIRSILNQADDYDTVVIGTHGGSLADRLFVGDVAAKIFRRSPVPVVSVR
jgi:nucleotide-binding universal stress UspA family protein